MTLQEFIEQHTSLETRSYSGRGMYGKKCLAVTAPNVGDVVKQLFTAALDFGSSARDFEEELDEIHVDCMGMDIVVYFPSSAYVEKDDDDNTPKCCGGAGCAGCDPRNF